MALIFTPTQFLILRVSCWPSTVEELLVLFDPWDFYNTRYIPLKWKGTNFVDLCAQLPMNHEDILAHLPQRGN